MKPQREEPDAGRPCGDGQALAGPAGLLWLRWRPADEFDQPEHDGEHDRDQEHDEPGRVGPEDKGQDRGAHGGDPQRRPVPVDPGACGPVLTPARSPVPLTAANPERNAALVLTAVTDGPVKNAPSATTRPSTSSTRSPCLMNRTIVSKTTAAASASSTLAGTLLR